MCLRTNTEPQGTSDANKRVCPECEQQLTPIAKKCRNCGADVSHVPVPGVAPKPPVE